MLLPLCLSVWVGRRSWSLLGTADLHEEGGTETELLVTIPATSADTQGWILLSQTSDLDNPKQKAAFLSDFS